MLPAILHASAITWDAVGSPFGGVEGSMTTKPGNLMLAVT
jgi:hypothetical protein